MSFVPSTALALPHAHNCLTYTSARPRISIGRPNRYSPICSTAASTASPSSASPADVSSSSSNTSIFACVSCQSALPDDLNNSSCPTCGRKYTDRNTHIDFLASSPSNPLSQLQRILTTPATQSIFESPLVSFAYERGWRDNFARAGFPGPTGEARLALRHVGRDGVLLDVSCGTGIFTRAVAAGGAFEQVYALDYSASMLEEAARRDKDGAFRRVRADVASMPFANEVFDCVVSGAAMHCWPKVQDGLAEISRVLKKDGRFFATTFLKGAYLPQMDRRFGPIGNIVRQRANRPFIFFDKEQLVWLLKAAGFSKVEVEALENCAVIRCVK